MRICLSPSITDLIDLLHMGLLTLGHPLSWEETQKYTQMIREHGIEQFINLYKGLKDRRNDCLKWGDEVSKRERRKGHAHT